jgi:carboxyl-terminal processing protease
VGSVKQIRLEQFEGGERWAYPEKMIRFSILFTLCVSFTFSLTAQAKDSALVCRLVPTLAEFFLRSHVAIKNGSDEINQKAAEQMIKRIDPSKALLLQGDIDGYKAKVLGFYRTMNNAAGPDCSDVLGIKNLLVQRAKEQLAYSKEVLTEKYKLDENAEFQLDPEKRSYPKNIEESKKRQLVQIHFQISNYLLTDMKLPKAREQLIHRYELSVKRMEELKEADILDYAVNAYASALDPHSNYLSLDATEDFQINMRLSLEGIGASLSSDDGFTVIQELIPGGAAAKSNLLLPKDKIIAVSDKATGTMVNVIDMDLKEVVKMIRGKAGTTVRLTILREKPEVQRLNVSLVRSKVQLEDDAAKVEMMDRTVDGKKYKLARIELPGFYGGPKRTDRSSYKDVLTAVEKAKKNGAEGIVLDLSYNSGGLLDEAVRIAGLFMNLGNVVATKDSDGEIQYLDDIDSRVQFAGPVVVYISRLSASASEIVAGALQDYKRAVIVGGDHTYGKGSVQAVLPLQNNFGIVKVTTGLFYIPGGNSTQHRGVTSDVTFPSPFSTEDNGEKHLDNSLPPGSIPGFLSNNSNEGNQWAPVAKAEIEKLRLLSKERVEKNKDFQEVLKELKELEEKKGLIKLSDMRKKESEQKKKNKDKAPKLLAKERNKPQIDEALNILADFVHLRKQGSASLITKEEAKKK